MTLSDYVLRELTVVARRPSLDEVLARIAARGRPRRFDFVAAVRAEREGRRRTSRVAWFAGRSLRPLRPLGTRTVQETSRREHRSGLRAAHGARPHDGSRRYRDPTSVRAD